MQPGTEAINNKKEVIQRQRNGLSTSLVHSREEDLRIPAMRAEVL